MPSELCFFTFGMFAAAVVGLLVRARPRPADDRACPFCGGTGVLPDGTHVEPVPADPPAPRTRPRSRSRRQKVGIWVPPSPEATPAGDLFLDGSKPATAAATAEHPHLPKLRALVRFGLAAARADGRVAASEKKVIRAFLTETFGHEPALLRQIDPLIERAEAEPEAAAVAAVVAVVPSGERAGVLRFADRVLNATGKRTAKKSKFHHRAAAAFGVADPPPTPPVPAPAPVPAPVAADPRAVLEIEPGTELGPDLIRRKFALLSEKLAAGKATAMGSDFARLAAEKRAALRAAAEALIAPFGVPLDPPAAPPPPADIRHNPDLDDIFGG